jgi:hypothetical protein
MKEPPAKIACLLDPVEWLKHSGEMGGRLPSLKAVPFSPSCFRGKILRHWRFADSRSVGFPIRNVVTDIQIWLNNEAIEQPKWM